MTRRFLVAVCVLVMLAGAALLTYSLTSRPDPASSAPPVEDGRPVAPATIDPGSLPVVGNGTSAQPRAKGVRLGEVLATMRIPALGARWTYPVIEGIRPEDLDRGMAHYPMTPLPGARGNAAFAGHRWDGPLYDFERLHVGDRVVITQRGARWVYRLTTEPKIIPVDAVWVIDPIAGHRRDRMLTLTTCWPKNGSSMREYVRARLTERN